MYRYLTRNNLMKAFRDDYDTPIVTGKKEAVVGAGNVAMDASRTALRLGAEVHIVYRCSDAELPMRVEEVHPAKEEGIIFNLLTNPVEIEGSDYVMDVDTVIISLGTSQNPLISSTTEGLETNRRKCIVAEAETGQTSSGGVFAGGDTVTGAATVILAMEVRKHGAKGIHEYLSGKAGA